jgi:serine/threonine protein kinase
MFKADVNTKSGKWALIFRFFDGSHQSNANRDLRVMYEVEKLSAISRASLYVAQWYNEEAFIKKGAICN